MNQNYKLSSLKIKNFRQYRDVTIKFSKEPDRMFTIIRGANGTGKTNIMNAITWCLYGKEQHLSDDEEDLPHVNTRILQENHNKIVHMGVILTLADDEGDQVRIERELSLYNRGDLGNIINDPEERIMIPSGSSPSIKKSFQWYDQNSGGWELTNYFEKSVNGILPEKLALYFLFDGERLEDFFEQVDDTKHGIEDVSQIRIVDDALKTLDTLITQKRRSAKNLDPKKLVYKEKMDDAEDKLKQLKKDRDDLDKQLKTKKDRKREIEKHIMKYGGDDARELQKRAMRTDNEAERLKTDLDELRTEQRDYVLKHMPVTKMLEPISNTLGYMQAKAKEGTLPPKIGDVFVKELLEGGECICGNDISEGTTSRTKISAMLEKAHYSQINVICTELRFALKALFNTGEVSSNLKKMQKEILDYEKLQEDKHEELMNLKTRIGNLDDKMIKKSSDEKQQLEKYIGETERNIGSLGTQITTQQNDFDKAVLEYEKEIRKDEKYTDLSNQLEFCRNASNDLTKIKDELLADVRNKVQQYTKKYFLKFLWKKDTYDDVVIDEDYKITTHHVDGYNARTSLSKGEKLVLALSFMAALRKITGFGFPLIIDTPLGRVSGEPRHNIARLLPDFLKQTQVTLLVTDSEYQAQIQDDDGTQTFPPIRDTINRYVGEDYNINFADGQSKVVTNRN